MILSHKYKFIFIKTNKTAGTSVEIALSKFLGDDDVITPIVEEDEQTRSDLGYRGPRNYLAPAREYNLRSMASLVFKGKKQPRFYNHIPAWKVKARVGEQVWNDYYKFCFERNPWDRVISHYYWLYKSEPRPAIREYLQSSDVRKLKRRGIELYTIDGQVAVDKVCRFEDLAEELEIIRKQVGIPEELELPHAKSKFREDKRSYHDILDEEGRATIAELFRQEIAICGYEY
jgi:hypothetical protein